MTEAPTTQDIELTDDLPVEARVQDALGNYIKAIDSAQKVLEPFSDHETITQNRLNQISNIVAVVE